VWEALRGKGFGEDGMGRRGLCGCRSGEQLAAQRISRSSFVAQAKRTQPQASVACCFGPSAASGVRGQVARFEYRTTHAVAIAGVGMSMRRSATRRFELMPTTSPLPKASARTSLPIVAFFAAVAVLSASCATSSPPPSPTTATATTSRPRSRHREHSGHRSRRHRRSGHGRHRVGPRGRRQTSV
jgi:hypothetical protein